MSRTSFGCGSREVRIYNDLYEGTSITSPPFLISVKAELGSKHPLRSLLNMRPEVLAPCRSQGFSRNLGSACTGPLLWHRGARAAKASIWELSENCQVLESSWRSALKGKNPENPELSTPGGALLPSCKSDKRPAVCPNEPPGIRQLPNYR